MVSAWASAQRHTYLKESYIGEKPYYSAYDLWDLSSSALDGAYVMKSQEAGGLPPEGLLGYYPQFGITQEAEGTFRMMSKPIQTKDDKVDYLSFRYFYIAQNPGTENTRKLGLAVREKNATEWTVCGSTSLLDTLEGGVMVAAVPEAFRGKEVVVSLFMERKKTGNQYLLYYDDIEFFGVTKDRVAINFEWEGEPYSVDEDTLAVNLRLVNDGMAIASSAEVSYTMDGGAVQTLPLTFDGTFYPNQTYTKVNFKPAGWADAAFGVHKFEFWLSKIGGEALTEDRIEKKVKTLTKINSEETEGWLYRPLVEQFSSSTCGPCARYNTTLNPMFESISDIMTLIKYQVNIPADDPYATEEGDFRRIFYGVNSVPSVLINAMPVSPSQSEAIKKYITNLSQVPVYYGLTIDTAGIDGEMKLHVTVSAKSVAGMDNVRLHAVVMENTTYGNAASNGETEFHHVMMKMMPDQNGQLLTMMPDSTYTFSYVCDMTQTHMEEFSDLLVACFLQTEDYMILQSAMKAVTSYKADAGAVAHVDYMPMYICAQDIPAGLEIVCTGGADVESLTVSARVGQSAPVTHDYELALKWGESAHVAFTDLKATETGHDTVYVSVTKVNGEDVTGGVNARPIVVQPTDYKFKPSMEGFVSANNAGSVAVNTFLDGLSADEFAVAKYPMQGDKYSRTAYQSYAANMGVSGTPGMALNGHVFDLNEDGSQVDEDYFNDIFEQAVKNNGIVSIASEGDILIGTKGSTLVEGTLTFDGPVAARFIVYAMVVETETFNNTGNNGEKKFRRVVQSIFPNENGAGITVTPGSATPWILSRAIAASRVEDYNNLSLLIMLKTESGEVVQTAEFKIVNKGVANENVRERVTLSVYPNPTADIVNLTALENARVEVYGMNGGKMYEQAGVNGDLVLDVKGYTPGNYIIKVYEGTKVSTARVSVVR